MIELRLLGANEIRIGRKMITPSAEVVFALGVYLCVRAGERVTREEVSETFWGEGRESQGRHSLRQMLYRLRQKGFTLDEEGEELYLDPARVDSDLTRALAEGWPAAASPGEVDTAAQLAPGFTRVITERFDEWLDGVRARLAAQHRRACLRQIAQARREGRWADLDRWALQVLRSDPLNEEATLARAESAAISGSKAVALEIIDAYVEELGDRAPMIGLPASILRRRIAERRADWSSRGPRDVPLVGREELMARLTGYVDAATNGVGNTVLLWGAPGIGKTRLAEEACAYAELEGFRTVRVRAAATGVLRPMGLLISLIPKLSNLPGAIGCAPSTLSILDRLTARGAQSTAAGIAPSETSMGAALQEAIRDLLDAVLSESRLVLFSDDLHNADSSSLSILQAAMPDEKSARLLWLGTSRTRPSTASSVRIFVPPLSAAEANDLASFVIPGNEGARVDSIVKTSGGNPLFILELSTQRSSADSSSLPRSLHQLITEGLGNLPSAHLRLLQLICLLGGQSTVARLRQLTPATGGLADQLEELEMQGLVHFSSARLVEIHECWQQAIESAMGSAVRAALALECARVLSSDPPVAYADALRAAQLLSGIGEQRAAGQLFIGCGEDLLARGLPVEALEVAQCAAASVVAVGEQVRLLLVQARAEHAAGMNAAALQSCRRGLSLCREVPRVYLNEYTTFLALQVELLQKSGDATLTAVSELGAAVLDDDLAPDVVQYACFQAMCAVFNSAPEPFSETLLLATRRSMSLHGPSIIGTLVELIHAAEFGQEAEVRSLEQRCVALDREATPVGLRTRGLYIRALAHRFIGDITTCERLATTGRDIATRHGLMTDLSRVLQMMIFLSLDQEDPQTCEQWLLRQQDLERKVKWTELGRAECHARARLSILRGEYSQALGAYEPALASIRSDPLARRRCMDEATLALCCAALGDEITSFKYLRPVVALIETSRPGFQIDYMVNAAIHAFILLRREDESRNLGTSYVERRKDTFPTPLPPALRHLREFILRGQKSSEEGREPS